MLTRVYRSREFVRFLVFGAIAALTTIASSWALYGTAVSPAVPYWCATGIGASLGLVVNFLLNYAWNFHYRDRSSLRQFRTFVVVSGFGVLLTTLLSQMNLFVFHLCVAGTKIQLGNLTIRDVLAANTAAVALVALYSFPAHKFISFNIGLGARLLQMRSLIMSADAMAVPAATGSRHRDRAVNANG